MAAAATLAACGGGDDPALDLQFSGLENLGAAAVYEGWLIVDGEPVSTGRFTVSDSGVPSQTHFAITDAAADRASAFVLTIEPATNDVPAPTKTHLLAGSFGSDRASAALRIDHASALGTNLASATGRFILATPSSAATDDNDQGIWWLEPVNGVMQPGLSLPTLPEGWVYEGWAVVNGTPMSTGRFTSASGADSDGAGPTGGPLPAAAFPGQDFINPPVKLPGGMAVISVEPEVDNSPAPFTLKPLNALIGSGTGGANVQVMTNTVGNGSSLPSGMAHILR